MHIREQLLSVYISFSLEFVSLCLCCFCICFLVVSIISTFCRKPLHSLTIYIKYICSIRVIWDTLCINESYRSKESLIGLKTVQELYSSNVNNYKNFKQTPVAEKEDRVEQSLFY